MRTLVFTLMIGSLTALGSAAQVIDGGRGEVPLRIPAGYSADKPTPLVVLLHGYTSSGAQQEGYMKFGELSDEYGFLFINPDGTKEASDRAHRFWNATSACCNFHGSDVDDSAYVRGLIEKVKAEYNVDANRIFLIGHSNGGFMSYRMAFDHSDTIAAIASLAGASMVNLENRKGGGLVSVLQIHGTNDGTIDYNGGQIGPQSYPSAAESASMWAACNGCEVEGVVAEEKLDLDKRVEGDETAITRFHTGCNKGAVAELWTIEGGSHIPSLSDTFTRAVIEWLYAHPKSE